MEGDSSPSLTPLCPQAQPSSARSRSSSASSPWATLGSSGFAITRPWTGRDAWAGKAGEPILPAVGDFYRVEGEASPRGGRGTGSRGHHRARPFPLPVPRRKGLPPRDRPGLSASRNRGGHDRRARRRDRGITSRPPAGDTSVAHATAYCQVLESSGGLPGGRAGPGHPAASPSSSSVWRTTSATSARCPATSASCPPRASAGGSAATSST